MAERLDGVLSELLVAQENEPAPSPSEEIPNTEPAAEGGNDAATEGTTEAATEEASSEEEAPISEETAVEPSGEVPKAPAPDPSIEALNRTAQALNGLQAENQQLRNALQQAQNYLMQQQKAQQEANRAREESVAQQMQEPPTLDLGQVQYMSDEERKAALAQYNNAVADYTKRSVMKELQPIVDQYHRQTKEAADAAVKNQLIGSGKFSGFAENADAIEKIIRATPGLSDLKPEVKYALGYVINRGVQSMNAPAPQPETVDELVSKVLGNPDALKAIEKQRAVKIAQANKAAPPIAASQGQNNAPATAPNPPKNLDEARTRARKIFGL